MSTDSYKIFGFQNIKNQQRESEKYPDLEKGPGKYGIVKRIRDNDPDLHSDKQVYSCGSLAPKLGRGGCSDRNYKRESQPWEVADGYDYTLKSVVAKMVIFYYLK